MYPCPRPRPRTRPCLASNARFQFWKLDSSSNAAFGGSPRSLFLPWNADKATHSSPTVVANLIFWCKNMWNFQHRKIASCCELWLYETHSLFYFPWGESIQRNLIWLFFEELGSFERVKKRKRRKSRAGYWNFQGYKGILCIWDARFFIFFLNNQIPQKISSVSKVLKLFSNLTNRVR